MFWCASCGYSVTFEHLRSEVPKLVPKTLPKEDPIIYTWNESKHPLHYYRQEDNLYWANIDENGNCIGLGNRLIGEYGDRQYKHYGKAGFRLNAKWITESTTDAIFLLEEGYDAGSICSAGNRKLLNHNNQVYIPHNDLAGLQVEHYIQKYCPHIYIFRWYVGRSEKDIRELPLEDFRTIFGIEPQHSIPQILQ